MTAPYLGGISITRAAWLSQSTFLVEFSSTYGSTLAYQIYAGRTLIGKQPDPAARSITGTVRSSRSPQPLTLIAVPKTGINTDYGGTLPLRPYNRVRVRITAASWPADSHRVEVVAGTTPGGAVDTENVIASELYDADREYLLLTKPFDRTGTWNLQIAGRDNRSPDGNRGTALSATADVVVYPPDFDLDFAGRRFAVSVASQTATFTYSVT